MKADILLSGVGGQGTVLASRILAQAAMLKGAPVRTAETVGMAQRSGCVVSHVRIGPTHSSMIPRGEADAIIASEPGEACRVLSWLKPGGLLVVADAYVPAVMAELSDHAFDPSRIRAFLREAAPRCVIVPVAGVEKACASAKPVNIALIGAALRQGLCAFTRDDILWAIARLVKPNFLAMNTKALDYGAAYKED